MLAAAAKTRPRSPVLPPRPWSCSRLQEVGRSINIGKYCAGFIYPERHQTNQKIESFYLLRMPANPYNITTHFTVYVLIVHDQFNSDLAKTSLVPRILGTTEGWPKRPKSCPRVVVYHHHHHHRHHQASQAEVSPGISNFKFPANRVLFPLPAWLAWWWWWWWWYTTTRGQNFRRLGPAWLHTFMV